MKKFFGQLFKFCTLFGMSLNANAYTKLTELVDVKKPEIDSKVLDDLDYYSKTEVEELLVKLYRTTSNNEKLSIIHKLDRDYPYLICRKGVFPTAMCDAGQ